MGNEKRLLILLRLLEGEVPVGVLAKEVGLSQSALSQHLAKLRGQGLVSTRREAQVIFYSTKNESVRHIVEALGRLSSTAMRLHPLPDDMEDMEDMNVARRSPVLLQMK